MSNDFDTAALNYDQVFTYSKIGIFQRQQVHAYLKKNLPENQTLRILEVNCGTGEDAHWMAQFGHEVLATDASEKMIEVAMVKSNNSNVEFKRMSIQDIDASMLSNRDLIFSNFGGFNCVSKEELHIFLSNALNQLPKGSSIILVLMPKNCLWDKLYMFLKGYWKSIGRRNTQEAVLVNLDGHKITTWYHNPDELIKLMSSGLKEVHMKPIGFFVPPSYMESFFKNKRLLLKGLNWLDKGASKIPFLARFSDHYLIHLKL